MTDGPNRIAARSESIAITIDNEAVQARAGEPIAAALLAQGQRICRTTVREGAARGVFCATGICGDCVMQVDGLPGVRTCITPVRAGMRVETQRGLGAWKALATKSGGAA